MQGNEPPCAKVCRPCATSRAPESQQYALLTEVLDVLKLDDSLRTSIIPDDLMRATSQAWRTLQRDNVPVKLHVREPAAAVRQKLEMFVRDGFHVTEVNLDWKENDPRIENVDEGMQMLAAVLIQCSLVKLDVSFMMLSDKGAIPLAMVTSWSPLLTHLNLEYNNIGALGAFTLSHGLRHCTSLQVLTINLNDIRTTGFKAIVDGLVECSFYGQTPALRSLNVSQNNIEKPLRNAGEKCELHSSIRTLTSHCTHLEVLDLTESMIRALQPVLYCLTRSRNMKSLSLCNCDLEFDDSSTCRDFMSALGSHRTLTTLDLSCNNFYREAFERLAQALPQCTTLTNLNLAATNLGWKSNTSAMAAAVAQSPHLKELDLSLNYISNDDENALKDAWLHDEHDLNLEFQDDPWS